MNSRKHDWLIACLFALVAVAGCDKSKDPQDDAPQTKQEALEYFEEVQRKAAETPAPPPVIEIPEVKGWSRGEPRPLPAVDRGFTIAYDHVGGTTVTLYQYTRGNANIPDDLDSQILHAEWAQARQGIQQALELGFYESAEELESKRVTLGNSSKQALCSRFALTVRGEQTHSDTYIWSFDNAIFKLRCTFHASGREEGQKIITPLLTALGNACTH